MHLILWRHAEAAEGSPDMDRELTRKGHRQARDMAMWLVSRLPEDVRIIASPAQRTIQTASALTHEFEIEPGIAPGASAAAVLEAAGWPDAGTSVVVIGHQPTLGEAASFLVTGQRLPWHIRKGAVWWLCKSMSTHKAQAVLRAVLSPDLLR